MRAAAALAALVLVAIAPIAAHAQHARRTVPVASAEPTASEDRPLRWIGATNLVVDAAALGIVGLGIGLLVTEGDSAAEGVLLAGAFTYALGGFVVHARQGHLGRGALSLVLHGAAVPAAAVFVASCEECSTSEYLRGPIVKASAILVGVSLFDAFVLGWEREPAPAPTGRTWTPTVAPVAGGGMSFGLGGTF